MTTSELRHDQFMTIPQAAEQLGVPVSTFRRAVFTGEIPYHRPFNQRIRVRLSEVIAAIERQGGAEK